MGQNDGGCLCGKLRYGVTTPPLRVNYCHCRFCQKLTGSAFLIEPVFVQAAFTLLNGEPAVFRHRSAGSGKLMNIHFCPVCATPLFMTFERFPEVVGVCGGTFDDDTWSDDIAEITRHLFIKQARPGTILPTGIACFDEHAITNDGKPRQPRVFAMPHVVGESDDGVASSTVPSSAMGDGGDHAGGCLCGEVRYTVKSHPTRVWLCHCTFCQQTTSSGYLIDPHFEHTDFVVTEGAPAAYLHRSSGSGRILKIHFCATCGTKVFLTFEHHSRVGVYGGTFDEPGWFDASGENAAHIFVSSARRGTVLPAGVECFAERTVTSEGEAIPPTFHDQPYRVG